MGAVSSTFALTDVQRDFQQTLRAFCEEKVAPNAAEADRNAEFPWKSFEACKEMELPASACRPPTAARAPTW